MKFGIFAPIPMATIGAPETVLAAKQALLPLPGETQDKQFLFAQDVLLQADQVGFDLCLFAERHLGHDLAAWVLASALGSQFKNMLSLVAVHPGLWDPVMIAKLAASLDRVTSGRMAVNIVNGWFDEEFRMFGGKVLDGDERYERAGDFIEILKGLWNSPEYSHSGRHYQIDRARLLLKPATATAPEIYSVSAGEKGREFIAKHCDWWFINYPKEATSTAEVMQAIRSCIADMNERSARYGRKVRYAMNPFIAIGKNEEDAIEQTLQSVYSSEENPDKRKIEIRMMPNMRAGLMGRPEDILSQLRRFQDLGLELILFKMIPSVAIVRKIGDQVISAMR